MICSKGKIKLIKLVLLLLAFFTSIKGMSQNDCVDAILICGNANLSGLTATGIGIQEINIDNACSSGENNSLWLKIKINTGGTLGFVLTPQSDDILEDLDFWIFGPNVSCSNLGTAIRCSTTNPLAINQPDNLTGMNSTETDVSEGPGFDGNSFIKWMDVLDNETYYIAIDRPTGVSAFSIAWTGTATFYQPPVPIATNNLDRCSLTSLPGSAIFDLTPNISLAIGNQTNVVANFFNSYNDAVTNTNPILNPNAYQNSTNPERIYLRLININTGCFAVTDFGLSVVLPSTTEFSYTTPVCINSVNPTVSSSLGFATGGVFSSTAGLRIDASNGTIDLALSIPGTYIVSYSLQANLAICQIATTTTFSITINPLPSISLQTSPQLFCINAAINPITFNIGGLVTGVVITSGNLPLGLLGSFNNGIFTINGTPSETGTFNYTLTTTGGCFPPATYNGSLTVVLTSVAGSISGTSTVCSGTNSVELILSGSIGTLQWQSSSDNVSFTSIPNATATTFIAANLTATTYYKAVVSSGACTSAATDFATITVIPLSVAGTILGGTTVCSGTNNTILTLSGNIGTIQWQSSTDNINFATIPSQTGNTFTATNLTTTTYYKAIVTSGTCAPMATNSISINVITTSVAGTISGGVPVCSGSNSSILTLSGNSGSIQWQFSTDAITFTSILNATTATYTAANLTTTNYYRVIVTNGSCTSASTIPAIIKVNPLPIATLPQDGNICVDDFGNPIGSFSLSTNLSSATNSFVWSNSSGIISGQTGSSYLAAFPGNYSVITTNNFTGCVSERATATIVTSLPPINVVANVSSYFSDIQTIIVNVEPEGIYEYKLDYNLFQENNEFTNLSMGTHEIWVRDKFGCGIKKLIVQIINYPNYFTPNGDSYHDTWNIIELRNQLNSYISIFDRYGKLIKQIKPSGPGWDGNYNGKPLPATDYWFTVYYIEQNKNEQFSSHFSLLR